MRRSTIRGSRVNEKGNVHRRKHTTTLSTPTRIHIYEYVIGSYTSVAFADDDVEEEMMMMMMCLGK